MNNRKFIITQCSQAFIKIIESRALQLDMDIFTYLKYSVLKEIEDNDTEEKELNKQGQTKY